MVGTSGVLGALPATHGTIDAQLPNGPGRTGNPLVRKAPNKKRKGCHGQAEVNKGLFLEQPFVR